MAEPIASQSNVKTGAQVWVATLGSHLNEEESGTVLRTGCAYNHPETGEVCSDGIMVKLQISNARGIFQPSQVTLFGSNPSPPPTSRTRTRTLRRARVTPSPTMDVVVVKEESSSAGLKKRKFIKTEEAKKDDAPAKKSKHFVKEASENPSEETDVAVQEFRVQRAASASSACKECNVNIRKNILRLQPTSKKRGWWYHVACVKSSFDSVQLVKDMEGYHDLTVGEQKLLRAMLLSGEDASEDEASDDKDKDPPLETLMKKPPLKKQTSKKPVTKKAPPKKPAAKKPPAKKSTAKNPPPKVDSDDEEDGDMMRASESDSDDAKDMPYRVEHAATGRATCRGCDERIAKGILRVAERPLFRGKPGFTVYRHLDCTIFTEQIERMQDVGGWRRLKKKNKETLANRVEESKVLVEKENQELEPDELVQASFQGEIRVAPKGLAASLLPFQVEGTAWMYHQEVHLPALRGGILADEMGMGKTVQTITVILDNRPKLQHCKPGIKHAPSAPDLEDREREEGLWKESLDSWHHEMKMANVPKKLLTSSKKGSPMGVRAGTLVVCPVIALLQWKEEIKKFTEDKTLSVCCYHGPNRAKEFPREVLCKFDVVLTTYQVIESDFRKMVSPNKVKCPNCGGSYKIDKLRVHLKYFCGESAQRTEAQARQRRSAPGRRNGSGNNNGDGGEEKKKAPFKSKTKAPTKMTPKSKNTAGKKNSTAKKSVRVKRGGGYDSDSELSLPDDLDISSPRPTRSAAKTATKKLAASAEKWSGGDTSDSEDFSEENEPSSGEDDESSKGSPSNTIRRGKPRAKESSESESSDSESEDGIALVRARKKQKLALERAKGRKNKGGGKKKSFKGSKGKTGRKGPAKVQKKETPLPDESSEDSSNESSDDEEPRDPLDGIDLEQLMKEAMAGSRSSVLHTMCWWRVVLDEAHMIKSRSSQTAAAAFALTSIYRWCLSGTPLQNRVGELYSLIRFCRIDPMAHYFCRKEGCDCKSIHYRMMHGKCQDCGHSSIQHFSHFNKHVLNPIQRAGYQGDGRRAMMKLKNEVLDKSLLRRTKQSRAEDMNLPPRLVEIRAIRLHPVENDFYEALFTQTKSSFDDYVTEGTLLNNYAHIFDLLTKMRQAVDHPYLIVYSKKNAARALGANTPTVANGSVDCEICDEPPTDRVVSSCCGFAFCRSCVIDYMSPALDNLHRDGTRCPSCKEPFSVDLNQASLHVVDDSTLTVSGGTGKSSNPKEAMPSLKEMTHVASGSILRRINLAEFATSTKVEALVQELLQMRQERPGSKALVFSQFVNMLDLVRWRLHSDPCLQDLGLGVRIIHGGMNIQSRDQSLRDFREDSSVRVLLMSLKAGGVALNLTVANEVYLLDPWWNPAAEMQAIDRTHRLGQYRPIRAVRFIAEGTVEERVLQLQEKKRLVFDGTVGRDAASLKMLTVDDMKAMFA